MARKVGQIIARGNRKWLIRVYLGHDHETNKRYYNRTQDSIQIILRAAGMDY